MPNLIQKALTAKRESKFIEFKQSFDSDKPGEWCELIKDLIAIANSGGGIIIIGLDNNGNPSGKPVDLIEKIDPSDISNKIIKYTGPTDMEFEIAFLKKKGYKLVAFVIQPVSIPVVFQKPGTYDIGAGKQNNAFSVGTVYFRHGAKSEPGTSDDIRRVVERQLEHIRKSWLKGVRKVVQAPHGSRIVTLGATADKGTSSLFDRNTKIRIVDDDNAIPVRLTRDSSKSSGLFIYEEISDGIFDEINNVIDANRALAKGQNRFFFGQSIYYRVYAERQHIYQNEYNASLLFHAGVSEFYAPLMFWALILPDEIIAKNLSELYFSPRNPNIHTLLRIAIILGPEFYLWLYNKWENKWKRHPQPPTFYYTFKEMISRAKKTDPLLVAARSSLTTKIEIKDEPNIEVSTLLDKPEKAAIILSNLCIKVFKKDDASLRGLTRTLDYITYGRELLKRGEEIGKAVIKIVGNRVVGDVIDIPQAGG
jgi:Putative DNA-binding domain